MCRLGELKPELHPPARLQNVQNRVRQEWHGAVSGICHNDENIGEEELHEIAQAIDDQIDSGIILEILGPAERSEGAFP